MQDMASPCLVHVSDPSQQRGHQENTPGIPPPGAGFALPACRGAQRGLQLPRDQIPHPSQLSRVTASTVPRCWAALGCLGAEAGNIKTAWAVLARAGAAGAGDCHVCEQKQRGLNVLPPPCPLSSFPVRPPGSQEKGGGGLGECSGWISGAQRLKLSQGAVMDSWDPTVRGVGSPGGVSAIMPPSLLHLSPGP